MSNEKYGGDIHAWIEPEIEARLVAMILGEASELAKSLDSLIDVKFCAKTKIKNLQLQLAELFRE